MLQMSPLYSAISRGPNVTTKFFWKIIIYICTCSLERQSYKIEFDTNIAKIEQWLQWATQRAWPHEIIPKTSEMFQTWSRVRHTNPKTTQRSSLLKSALYCQRLVPLPWMVGSWCRKIGDGLLAQIKAVLYLKAACRCASWSLTALTTVMGKMKSKFNKGVDC